METALRAALIGWLSADPTLSAQVNSVTEEAPAKAFLPWIAIASSASADWGCKDRMGREIRIALELHCRGDRPDAAADLVRAIEDRIGALPSDQGTFSVVTAQFLRARTEQRPGNLRAMLFEYRFRVLAD